MTSLHCVAEIFPKVSMPARTTSCTANRANEITVATVISGKRLFWWYAVPSLFCIYVFSHQPDESPCSDISMSFFPLSSSTEGIQHVYLNHWNTQTLPFKSFCPQVIMLPQCITRGAHIHCLCCELGNEPLQILAGGEKNSLNTKAGRPTSTKTHLLLYIYSYYDDRLTEQHQGFGSSERERVREPSLFTPYYKH